MDTTSSGVQSLDRAFSLIEMLAANPSGMLLSEITAQSGLHKSTVHRLLAALTHWGYVKKSGERGDRYSLTLKMLEISGPIVESFDIAQIARPLLDKLRDEVGETVHLVVHEGIEIVYIYKAECMLNTYRMSSHLGMRREMYCTAAGKSLLAHMPRESVSKTWYQSSRNIYTESTIRTLAQLQEDLDLTSKRGYALDMEENEMGVRCIAAAISDYSNNHPAAISVSAPTARMSEERIKELAPIIMETAAEISREMGYRG